MRTITYWLSILLILTLPWENILNLESLGRISRVIGFIVTILWLATVLFTRKIRKPNSFHVVIYLFILWNMVTILWSVNPDRTISRIQTYLQLFVFVLILWDYYSEPLALKAGLQAYVLGAYVSIGSTIYNYNQGNIFNYDRFSANGFNPNDLALILSLGIPAAWYLAITDKDDRLSYLMKTINFVYVPAATFAIFLTVSRAALISLVLSLLFVLSSLTRFRVTTRIIVMVALIISFFVVRNYIPPTAVYLLEKKQGNLTHRDIIWNEGVRILSEHIILGVGSNAFATANKANGQVAHNIFLGVIAETGIVGFCLFLLILALAAYQLKYLPKGEMMFWLAILLILMIGGLTHNVEDRKQMWLFLSFLVAYGSFFRKQTNAPFIIESQKS